MTWQGLWPSVLINRAIEPFGSARASSRDVDEKLASAVFGLLFLSGGALGLISLPFLGDPLMAIERCGIVLVFVIALGIELVANPGRIGRRLLSFVPALGCIAVFSLIIASGPGGAAIYGLMLFWPVSTAAFLLSARVAGLTFALAVTCLGAGQLIVGAPFAVAQTVVCAGVLGATVLLIFGLRRRAEDALQTLELVANTDSLSGVANRRAFERHLEGALHGRRSEDNAVAVVLIDLDNFKQVNDIWGHEMGDEIVRETGAILRSQTRTGDLAARLGGDEFAILVEGSNAATALGLGNRLRAAIEERFEEDPHGLTVSIGVSWGSPGMSPAEVMRTADGWLYEAKTTGRNRVIGDPDHIGMVAMAEPSQLTPAAGGRTIGP